MRATKAVKNSNVSVRLEAQSMYKNKMTYYIVVLAAIASLTGSGQALAANYPLEIIQPRTGLDTKNRFYKAYPGLEYNVRLAVIGGAYPFSYSLTTAPSGMTINSNTGVITWPNPIAASAPYSVTARVTDQEGSTASVPWTITVTTSGFLFLDAVNGRASTCNGGSATGTIGDPFKTMNDWYCGSSGDNRFANSFLYFRSGTYPMNTPAAGSGWTQLHNSKPLVWLAYPGESPSIDSSGGSGDVNCYGGCTNLYIDGFEFKNVTNQQRRALQLDGNASYVVIRRNNFHGVSTSTGALNQSLFMIANGGSVGKYYSIQDNTFSDVDHGYGILGYGTDRTLVENNTFYDIRDTTGQGAAYGVSPKSGTSMWFIRTNTFHHIQEIDINVQYAGSPQPTSDIEVSYNLSLGANVAFAAGANCGSWPGGPVRAFRNTFIGGMRFINVDDICGPFYAYNNVVINGSTSTDHIDCILCKAPARVIITNNLSGTSAATIVDAAGNLTSAYLAYLGTTGHQINGNMPAPPKNLTVQ
jgi:hypothetical protein